MTRKTFTAFCLATVFAGAGATETLQPKQTIPFGPIGEESRHFVYPLEELGVSFSRTIEVLPEAAADIVCEGEVVARSVKAELAYNYTGKKSQEGVASFFFDKQNLPKGKSYSFVVAPSSIRSAENPEMLNGRIEVPFLVPENLGPARWGAEENEKKVIASASSLTAYWGYETTKAVDNPYAVLYREGVEVSTYPLYVTWDWNLGQAYVRFTDDWGKEMHFEKDVHYSVRIPAGMVGVLYRTDIVNEETEFSFVGGYTEPVVAPQCTSMHLRIDKEANTIQGVDYLFSTCTTFGPDPKVQLWAGDTETLVAEVTPYQNTMVNCFMVSADFPDIPLDTERGNTIVLTEGSVVSTTGDPVGNQRTVLSVPDHAGIHSMDISEEASGLPVYDIYGRRISNPVKGEVYIRGGRKYVCH